MSRVCDICNKGRLSGNNVSHSHRKSRRIWSPNLKKVRTIVNGSAKTLDVCTRCMRTGKTQRAQ